MDTEALKLALDAADAAARQHSRTSSGVYLEISSHSDGTVSVMLHKPSYPDLKDRLIAICRERCHGEPMVEDTKVYLTIDYTPKSNA